MNNLPRVAPSGGTAGNRTRDLLIRNLTPYHYTTKPHLSSVDINNISVLTLSSIAACDVVIRFKMNCTNRTWERVDGVLVVLRFLKY